MGNTPRRTALPLAVLFGALGVLVGFKLGDPLVGALITFAILFMVKDAAVTQLTPYSWTSSNTRLRFW